MSFESIGIDPEVRFQSSYSNAEGLDLSQVPTKPKWIFKQFYFWNFIVRSFRCLLMCCKRKAFCLASASELVWVILGLGRSPPLHYSAIFICLGPSTRYKRLSRIRYQDRRAMALYWRFIIQWTPNMNRWSRSPANDRSRDSLSPAFVLFLRRGAN